MSSNGILPTSVCRNDGEFVNVAGLVVQARAYADLSGGWADSELLLLAETIAKGVVDDGVHAAVWIRRWNLKKEFYC